MNSTVITSTKELYKFVFQRLKKPLGEGEASAVTYIILDYFFDLDRTAVLMNIDILPVEEEDIMKLEEVVALLKKGEPIQYILGETPFFGLSLFVNKDVLIPRQETEELVDLIVKESNQLHAPTIIDIGTGSGCIALGLKKMLTSASIFAMDVSMDALAVAQDNSNELALPIQLVHENILDPSDLDELPQFDIIVSNPPYVTIEEKSDMEKNVVEYEPPLALFVENEDPLKFYKATVDFSLQKLKPGGTLYFEINELFGEETANLLRMSLFSDVEIIKDLNGKDRFVKGKHNPS